MRSRTLSQVGGSWILGVPANLPRVVGHTSCDRSPLTSRLGVPRGVAEEPRCWQGPHLPPEAAGENPSPRLFPRRSLLGTALVPSSLPGQQLSNPLPPSACFLQGHVRRPSEPMERPGSSLSSGSFPQSLCRVSSGLRRERSQVSGIRTGGSLTQLLHTLHRPRRVPGCSPATVVATVAGTVTICTEHTSGNMKPGGQAFL